MKFTYLLVTLLVCSSQAFASTTFTCQFSTFSDNEGTHEGELSLTYLVDEDAGKAYMIGNNGSNEVVEIYKGDGRSFIEVTSTGNVMVTTVTPDLKAVHSRNSVMFGELIPTQYYGECLVQ